MSPAAAGGRRLGLRRGLSRRDTWTRAALVDPSPSGFFYVGVSSGPWRLPAALPRTRRRRIAAELRTVASRLLEDPRVVRADIFTALVRPPGGPLVRARTQAMTADFDVVLLVECRSVEDAEDIGSAGAIVGLEQRLRDRGCRHLISAASNVRRMGPVDHDRPGVFLFNYFSAPSVAANLFAWQYTAGWFQHQTGLDNSTVLQPVNPSAVPYRLINHCRWDRLRDILPALVFKPSFRTFVLSVFGQQAVVPHPILYRLHSSVGTAARLDRPLEQRL